MTAARAYSNNRGEHDSDIPLRVHCGTLAQPSFPQPNTISGVFESPDELVIATRQVMEEGWPILLVTHDADEPSGWQFLNGHGDTDDPASGVTLHVAHVLERDSSVAELADLPAGWQAWRATENDAWIREPTPPDGETP